MVGLGKIAKCGGRGKRSRAFYSGRDGDSYEREELGSEAIISRPPSRAIGRPSR